MPLTRSRQKAGNVFVLVLVIALNGLAASGAMSGDSIGVIANRYRSLFLPADYVFGIWSLIYLGLIATAIYQALPTAGAERAVQRLGIWWAVTGALNVAWISLFSFGQFALALLVMVIFLITLIAIGERVRGGTRRGRGRADPSPLAEQAFLIWPQDIYLAWISVALIANSFQFAQAVQWSGFGIAESTWAVTMMLVATLLGVTMAWARGNWLFAASARGTRRSRPSPTPPVGWCPPASQPAPSRGWPDAAPATTTLLGGNLGQRRLEGESRRVVAADAPGELAIARLGQPLHFQHHRPLRVVLGAQLRQHLRRLVLGVSVLGVGPLPQGIQRRMGAREGSHRGHAIGVGRGDDRRHPGWRRSRLCVERTGRPHHGTADRQQGNKAAQHRKLRRPSEGG